MKKTLLLFLCLEHGARSAGATSRVPVMLWETDCFATSWLYNVVQLVTAWLRGDVSEA